MEMKGYYNNTGDYSSSPCQENFSTAVERPATGRKRLRSRGRKDAEEEERQRRTHITVERNRRKIMNDYLHVLRSMMPPTYVQRGDQASIVGGAINFLKEVEQLLQSLEAQKWIINNKNQNVNCDHKSTNSSPPLVFSDFFTFPQYSNYSPKYKNKSIISSNSSDEQSKDQKKHEGNIANVEVTMVERHASLKILTQRNPKQLWELVVGFCSLGLTILHLNVTSLDNLVLYSLCVEVEEECQLNSTNKIAAAAYGLVGRVQGDATFDNLSNDS